MKRQRLFRAVTIAMLLGLFLIVLSKLFNSAEYDVDVAEEHLEQAGFSQHHSGTYIRVTKMEDYGELLTLVLLQESEGKEDCSENQDRIDRDGETYLVTDYKMRCPHYTIHITEITKDLDKSHIPAEISHVLDLLSPYMNRYIQPMKIIGSVLCVSSTVVMLYCLYTGFRTRKLHRISDE